jgi:anti-sigma B factor antagonist
VCAPAVLVVCVLRDIWRGELERLSVTGCRPVIVQSRLATGPGAIMADGSLSAALARGLTVGIHRVPGRTSVAVSGEIDFYSAPALRHGLDDAVDGDVNGVLAVDLSGVTFMDAAGLGVLVGERQRLEARGGAMALSGARPIVARLLELTDLARIPAGIWEQVRADSARCALGGQRAGSKEGAPK